MPRNCSVLSVSPLPCQNRLPQRLRDHLLLNLIWPRWSWSQVTDTHSCFSHFWRWLRSNMSPVIFFSCSALQWAGNAVLLETRRKFNNPSVENMGCIMPASVFCGRKLVISMISARPQTSALISGPINKVFSMLIFSVIFSVEIF